MALVQQVRKSSASISYVFPTYRTRRLDTDKIFASEAIRLKIILASGGHVRHLRQMMREACITQGKYNEAEPLYLRSLAICEQQLGADHPDIAQSLNNLANLYESQGKYSEAEPLYQKALQICEQVLGIGHPNTMTVRENYAQCLKKWASSHKLNF